MCRRNGGGARIAHAGVLRQTCEPQEEDLLGGCQARRPYRDIAVGGVGMAVGADVIAASVLSTVHEQVEGMVRYTAVGMHAAVVGAADLPLVVVIWIVVLARVGHVAEAHHDVGGQIDVLADPPVRTGTLPWVRDAAARGVFVGEELSAVAEHIRKRLVQGTGLVLVDQVRRALGDPVSMFMGNHIQTAAQRAENCSITIAIDGVGSIPEGIVVVVGKVGSSNPGGGK